MDPEPDMIMIHGVWPTFVIVLIFWREKEAASFDTV